MGNEAVAHTRSKLLSPLAILILTFATLAQKQHNQPLVAFSGVLLSVSTQVSAMSRFSKLLASSYLHQHMQSFLKCLAAIAWYHFLSI